MTESPLGPPPERPPLRSPELPLLVQWEEFIDWLFTKTTGFPKRLRHSLTQRIEARSLEILERLVMARWSADRKQSLAAINLELDVLRVLVRVAHRQRCLDTRAYEYAARELDTAGKMLGGWLRSEG